VKNSNCGIVFLGDFVALMRPAGESDSVISDFESYMNDCVIMLRLPEISSIGCGCATRFVYRLTMNVTVMGSATVKQNTN